MSSRAANYPDRSPAYHRGSADGTGHRLAESCERSGSAIAFGPFRLYPAKRLLERDGMPVELGGRALDILVTLVRNAGDVISKSDLLSSVWPDTVVAESGLRVHITSLRRALREGEDGSRYVTNVAGRGYCFVAPIAEDAETLSHSSRPPARPEPVTWGLAHGLPPRLKRMAGRDETVRSIVAELAEHRFVTIVGAGGIGKTTVAVSVAHALLQEFSGAVRFVDLGALTDCPCRIDARLESRAHRSDGFHFAQPGGLPP